MVRSSASEEPARVPPGRPVELSGRGTCFVREVPGPPGAPTVILIHAFAATSGLNWFTAFEHLASRFRVVAPDLRGHGRGLRSPERFAFPDCADDIAALAAELGVESAVVAGYSLGGPIAQLVWKRHRHLVRGLVLAATSYRFVHSTQVRILLTSAVGALAQATRYCRSARFASNDLS